MAKFKLTAEEAAALKKIARATGNDWFHIDESLEAKDLDGFCDGTDSCVRMLGGNLCCGLDRSEGGGLSPEECEVAEKCFARADAIAMRRRARRLKAEGYSI